MNTPLRYLRALSLPLRGKRVGAFDDVRLPMRVSPLDIDSNLHMTNARYLEVMNAGRVALFAATPLGPAMWRTRARPVLVSVHLRYQRELRTGVVYDLVTALLGWSERDLYIKQAFEVGERTHAVALCRCAIVGGAMKRMPVAELAEAAGLDPQEGATRLPGWVGEWLQREREQLAGIA